MDDYFNEDEYEDYYNNPDSLDVSMPHDEHADYQRIQEELYQKAYDAEFERATNYKYKMFTNDRESNVKEKSLTLSNTETPVKEKKKKRKRNSEYDPILENTNKKRKSDENDENSNKEVNKDDVSIIKKSKKPKTPSKNHSLKEVVEDAGLTMDDLQLFIDDGNKSEDDMMIDLTSDPSSEYITVSETSDGETASESEDDSSNEIINLNIVNRSQSKDDTTLSIILDSLPDNGSWNISSSDIIGQSNSSTPRFHNFMKKLRCSNCNERGHQRHLCLQPKKVIKCILCGDSGHMQRNCPDQLCFRCDQPGHAKGDCKERIASYHDRCKRCYVKGHFEERCPDSWRQYHLTLTGEKVLRERDLKVKNVDRKNKQRSCYNCGENGHLGHTCQESRMDKFQTVCTPYIFRYDKEQIIKDESEEEQNVDDCIEIEVHERSPRKVKSKRSKKNHKEEFKIPKYFGNLIEEGVEHNSSRSRRSTKETSHKRDTSKRKRKDRNESSMTDHSHTEYTDFENRKSKPLKVVPLMELSIPGFSSTPMNRNSKKPKLVEPDLFPREEVSDKFTPANSRQKAFNFISPINPPESFSDLDASPERHIDSYHMEESMLQNNYYGKEQMKKARKKQARKEKKSLLKEQQLAMRDKRPKKQWWSVSKSQQHELSNEMNGHYAKKRNKSANFDRTNNSWSRDENNAESSAQKRRRRRNEGHNKNIGNMSRGFKLGMF